MNKLSALEKMPQDCNLVSQIVSVVDPDFSEDEKQSLKDSNLTEN